MIVDPASYLLFVGASLVLLLSPGPAVLFIFARAVSGGRKAGVVASLGLGLGNLVHVIFVVFGLTALLASSAVAYSVLKYLGAAYLVYLGIRKIFFESGDPSTEMDAVTQTITRDFREGVVVNVLNPKVALFFLAFLPQFVDPAPGHIALQLSMLGITFVVLGLITDIGYALLVGTARQWLLGSRVFNAVQRYLTGFIYIGLGAIAAISEPRAGR